MDEKIISKFVCKNVLGKKGNNKKRCEKNTRKIMKTAEAVVTIIGMF